MSAPKKPNANSPLRLLPEERQAEIIARMKAGKTAAVLAWLKDDGFKTSTGALSEFWSWWHLRQQFTQNQSDVETLLNLIRKEEPALSEDKIFAMGQQVFSVLALKSEKPGDWAKIQLVRQRQAKLGLEASRIAVLEKRTEQAEKALELALKKFKRDTCELFLKWYGEKAAKEITTSNMSHSDKIEKLGQTMFGEDW